MLKEKFRSREVANQDFQTGSDYIFLMQIQIWPKYPDPQPIEAIEPEETDKKNLHLDPDLTFLCRFKSS